MVGFFVEFREQRHHAAVGVFQFARQLQQVVLARLQFGQGGQKLAVLLLHFGQRDIRGQRLQAAGQRADHAPVEQARVAREQFVQRDLRAFAGRAVDMAAVHQALGAQDAQAHARGRAVGAGQYLVELRDAGALVLDADAEHLWRRLAIDGKMHLAAAGVVIDVARQFRHGRGDAHLVLHAEAAQGGDLPRALACAHHIEFAADMGRQYALRHVVSLLSAVTAWHSSCSRSTTTVTSSRPRAKSRYSTAATRLGWHCARPGYCSRSQRVCRPSLCMIKVAPSCHG
ncbi:hypothetical protein D3C72_1483230 [compost metagenome]